DREASVLLVKGSFAEENAPAGTVPELAAELEAMAGWLGLEGVVIEPNGDLAAPLAKAIS
ncbi:MAG: winged helix-turn-helix domain-containing protein, partial [Solirubrobacterales bacterium]